MKTTRNVDGWDVGFWICLLAMIVLFIAAAWTQQAHAAGDLCEPLAARKAAAEKTGTWTVVTQEEWEFLRGIYAMNPETPPGIPFGDHAALIQRSGNEDGAVVFIDGDQACTPMRVPHVLIQMLATVAAGQINHQGAPL